LFKVFGLSPWFSNASKKPRMSDWLTSHKISPAAKVEIVLKALQECYFSACLPFSQAFKIVAIG